MGRNFPLLICVLLALITSAWGTARKTAVPTREEDMMRQVLQLEHQSREAALHNDASFVQRTLADDYVAIGPLGNVVTKTETLAARRQGQVHYEAINISEMVVRIYGDTAIVTAKAVVKGSDLGEDFSGPYRFTRIWVKRNGQWLTASYQATVTQ